jgi:glutamyl-tRNA synthetase
METLSDFVPLTAFLSSGLIPVAPEKFKDFKLDENQLKEALQFSLWDMEALDDWNREAIFISLKALADGLGIKLKDFLAPLFIAISGTTASFSVMDAMALLGPELTRARLRNTLNIVCGEPGKKQLKKLEKAYQQLKSA